MVHMLDVRQTAEYTAWFNSLRDRSVQARLTVRVRRLQEGNPGQHRVLNAGVAEMKIDVGPGYRVYYTRRGMQLILLLVGGDKTTQQTDIETAIRLAKEI